MFVIGAKKWRNPTCIKRNAFEQTLFVKYSKSHTAKFQHNMVGAQFTTEQRTFMVPEYNLIGSPQRVIERIEERFPDRQPPWTLRSIRHMGPAITEILKSLEDDEQLRSVNNIKTVHEGLRRDPRICARRNPTGISKTTFNRITKLDLKWHP